MEIIVLRLDRIGDFILGIPAYRALKQAHPNDRITAVVSPLVKDLAEACPYFDEVYLYEAQWLIPGRGLFKRWRSALKLAFFLRSLNAGMVLDFRHQSRLDAVVTGFSGAEVRVGFDLGFLPSLLLNRKSPQPSVGMHQVDRNLLLLKAIGIETQDKSLEMWTHERDHKTALRHLPLQEALPGTPRIAVHIGAATPSKQWPTDHFGALVQELASSMQAEVMVLGGVDDVGVARDVTEGIRGPIMNLVGKLDLRQTAALIKTCNVFVGGDSGPGHIAAACGVPVVSLFSGANRSEEWKPWGDKVKVLGVKPDCSPCQAHNCTRLDAYFCMEDILLDQVLEAVRGFLVKPA